MHKYVWHHGAVTLGRVMIVFVLLLIIVGVAHTLAFRRTIFPFVYISGVEVSNLNAEEAASLVNSYINNEDEGIWLVIEDQSVGLKSQEVGLEYGVQEAVSEAWSVGRGPSLGWNIWERVASLIYKRQIDLPVIYDEEAFEGWLVETVSEAEVEAVEPSLAVVGGEIVFVNGKDGKKIDEEKLMEEIIDNLNKIRRTNIVARVATEKQEVSEEKADEIVRLAESLVGREISIVGEVGEDSLFEKVLDEEDLVELVGFFDKWNEDKIMELAEEVAATMNRSPVNARFEKTHERIVDFAPHKVGVEVEVQKFRNLLVEVVETGIDELSVPYQQVDPDVKAGEINNLGIKELLGRGESNYFHSIPNRIYNVALGASRLNGLLVAPDEVFSFNRAIGEVSGATGYKVAWIISGGRTVLGDGGGMCQVSTTLFRAILNAGLPIVERKAHAYRVEYYEQGYPMGLDATVYGGSADLKFKNDTGHWLLIQSEADSKNLHLTFDIYGTRDGRVANISDTKVFSTSGAPASEYIDDPSLPAGQVKQIDWAAGGARVAFDYVVTRGDETLINKTFYSNYQPWRAVYLRGTGN